MVYIENITCHERPPPSSQRPLQPPLPEEGQHDVPLHDLYLLPHAAKQDFHTQQPFYRESSFLQHDIAGTAPKVLIPKSATSANFGLSTFVEPIPDRNKHINKTSNPLFVGDIEGARPKAVEFRSRRNVDPLCPKYTLPSAS
jgi:hypothetical protein